MRMQKIFSTKFIWLAGAVLVGWLAGAFLGEKDSRSAYGGMIGPLGPQQSSGRFQISACDPKTAWVIDTAVGDVFLIFSNGKWKDVGSILDERTRIRKE